MFLHLCRKVQLPVLLTAILLIFVSIPVSAQNNCSGNLNSASNKDASWNGWDNLISRLRSNGCEFVDISMQMFSNAAEVPPVGGKFDYVIVAENVGTATAEQVIFSSDLAGEVRYFNGSTDTRGDVSGVCFFGANSLECDVILPAGSSIVLTVTVEVVIERSFSNTVTLDAAPGDLDPRNNSATVFLSSE